MSPCTSRLPADSNTAAATIAARSAEIEARWTELCRWDPAQAPDAGPVLPQMVLGAIADAVRHPQPLVWGLDPALVPVVEAFATHVASPHQAIAQLACLRVALHEIVVHQAPPGERNETLERVSSAVDHTMMVAARVRTSQLSDEALTDSLTGLANRRAFDRDLATEVARARRTSSPLTLAVIDLDGLKVINDSRGHAAGDRAIATMGDALSSACRRSDRAYRIGGDEFALLLTDALVLEPELIARRLADAGAPACTVGTASSPPEALDHLFVLADEALYRARSRARSGGAVQR